MSKNRRSAKRADRPRGAPPTAAGREERRLEPVESDRESTRLEETDEELEAEVDAAAEELRETGVAHRIASGERDAASKATPAGAATGAAAPARTVRTASGRAVPAGATATQLPYVDDRVSKVWVVLVALTMVAVLAYGFLGGQGGYLTRTPSPSPSPSPAVSPSPTGSPTTPSPTAS